MASLITLPTENILEVGEYLAKSLSKRDIVSLYSTCRRLREILATSIRRKLNITFNSPKLIKMSRFAKENSYFARSISVVRLLSTDLRNIPSKPDKDAACFLEKVAKELEEERGGSYEEIKDLISLGNERSYMIILLTTLNNLDYFHYIEQSGDPKLKMAVLTLLSGGRYLQKLKRFEYLHLHSDKRLLEQYNENAESENPKQPGSQLIQDKDAPVHLPQLVERLAALERVCIHDKSFDMNFLQTIVQIPSSLNVLDLKYFHYVPSGLLALSTLRNAIGMQARSIQRISISLDPVNFWKDPGRGSGGMDGSTLGHLQNCVALRHLKLPVDALLGTNNDPKKGDTIPSWSRNLPSSLTSVFLDLGFFRTHDQTPLWTSTQTLNGLIIGMPDLLSRCPDLRKMTVACLLEVDFNKFQRILMDKVKDLEILYDGALEQELRNPFPRLLGVTGVLWRVYNLQNYHFQSL